MLHAKDNIERKPLILITKKILHDGEKLHNWYATDKLYNAVATRNCVRRHRSPFCPSRNTEATSVSYRLDFCFQDVSSKMSLFRPSL